MIINVGPKLWLVIAAILVFLGLSVFAITRHIYTVDLDNDGAQSPRSERPLPAWTDRVLELDDTIYESTSDAPSLAQNPAELSAQANRYFANKQYSLAAEAYERLLAFDPGDANVMNNLGLTLHYVGRSDEALEWLLKGSRLDPMNQRLWLTLGFVSRDVGNIAQARAALATAARMDPGNDIGISAASMLEALPWTDDIGQ